jgi:hypothetical protein
LPRASAALPPPDLGGLLVTWPDPLFPIDNRVEFALLSDLHIGGQNTDHDLISRELAQAQADGARILLNGDLFDLILPGDRQRYAPSALHPRLRGPSDIINKVVDWGLELLGPVAEHLDLVGVGNHDHAGVKFASVDPVLLLVDRLNDLLEAKDSPHRIAYGGYAGMACYRLGIDLFNSSADRFTIFYHHGWGKGSSLRASAGQYGDLGFVEGCDVYWLGHLHSRLTAHVLKVAPPTSLGAYEPVVRDVRFVRTGSYLHTHRGQSLASLKSEGR